MGIGPGDTVAMSCPNIPQFLMIYYGILRAGAAAIPLNILLKPREIAYYLTNSKASVYFCFEGAQELPIGDYGLKAFEEAKHCISFITITADIHASQWQGQKTLAHLLSNQPLSSLVSISSSDNAAILYTSGTTGDPKGAALTHHNLSMNTLSCIGLTKTDSRDTHLITLPLFHSFAQTVQMHHAIAAGSTIVLLNRFDAETALNTMAKEKVSVFAGVPTMYIAMIEATSCLPPESRELITDHLRVCISGGGPMPVEVLHQFEQIFRVSILEGYGLSETSPVACFNTLDQERMPGSVGRPVPGVQVRVVDENDAELPAGKEGQLLIKGHNVMKGYLHNEKQTDQAIKDGWFYTGDIARIDDAKNVYIVDRLKDLIIRGGFNVYPREIEEVLLTHPAIVMAAVIGVPDDHYVEEIMACLVLKEGAKETESDLMEWSKERLGCYKYPRKVKLFNSLPLTATGKVLKRKLKEIVKAEQPEP